MASSGSEQLRSIPFATRHSPFATPHSPLAIRHSLFAPPSPLLQHPRQPFAISGGRIGPLAAERARPWRLGGGGVGAALELLHACELFGGTPAQRKISARELHRRARAGAAVLDHGEQDRKIVHPACWNRLVIDADPLDAFARLAGKIRNERLQL